MMQFYVELNKPDSGSLSIAKNDPIYSQIEIGKLVKVVYRGQPRGSGGFFVENVQRDDAKSGDLGEEWVKITGRGALSILEDAIIDYDAGGEAQRSFASQTMAAMLITLLTEAQARGCFPKLRWNFSGTMDSAGDAWDDLQSLSFSVGSSLLDVLASMTDLGIDFRMSYDWVLGDYVLYGYALGIGDLRSGVVFRKGLNAEEVTDTQESGELKNSYLVQYTGGSTWINDAASAAAYRRRETAFSAGSADNASDASMLANVQLSDTKDPKRQISIKVSDAAGPRVFVDYGLGDWVYYDRGDGQTPSLYRIRAMTLDWGDIQYPSITLDLNSILLEREIKNEIALRKIGGSNIGSTLSSPTDAGAELTLHKTDATAHSSRPLGGDLTGTLGVPAVAKLRGVALDNPLTISDGQVLKFDSALAKLVGADVDWTEIASKPGTFTPSAHTHVEADITDLDAVPEAPADGTEYVRKNAGWVSNSGGSGADANAIHVNEASEINGITEKTAVANDDVFLIEDSADSYNKKRVKASNLPSGGGGNTVYSDNYANRPTTANQGDLFFATDTPIMQRYDGSAWKNWGKIMPLTEPPTISDLSWVNQGSATAVKNGGIIFLSDATDSVQNRILVKPINSSSFNITACISAVNAGISNEAAGVLIRDSTTGYQITFSILQGSNGQHISITKWTGPTAWNGSYLDTLPIASCGDQIYFKIFDNGANRYFAMSKDGKNYINLLQQSHGEYLSPNEAGFFIGMNGVGSNVGLSLFSLKIE